MMLKVSVSRRAFSVILSLAIILSSLFSFSAFPMFVSATGQSSIQATYYVSPMGSDSNDGSINAPFQTIEKARDVVRTINSQMTGDIYVYLRGGDYRVTSTIKFGPEDSGTNGYKVYYEAYPGETPVINGATKVTGWTQYSGNNNIYEADLNRDTKLRNLYVNDKRAQMTSITIKAQGGTTETYSVVAGQASWAWASGSKPNGVKYNAADLPVIASNQDDLEITNGSTWNENIVCVSSQETSADGNYRILRLQEPYGSIAQLPGWGTNFSPNANATHKIFNAFEFMNAPGQFYFNKTTHKLYYYPRVGEDMNTADVEAPVIDKLIDIAGTSKADRVKDITFKGITFANTDWQLFEVGGSHGKATVQGATGFIAYGDGNWHNSKYEILDTNPGMINVCSSDSIDFIGNTVKHSGADGISMVNDVINSDITGNYIYDIASSGITVGHPQHVYLGDGGPGTLEKYAPDVEGICTNDTITNNMMYDISTCPGFGGCAGVTAFFVDGLNISYNTIHTTAYNGINLGWGWQNFLDSTTCKNNTVSNNRLYNTLNRLHDSGAVYTLGQMPNTSINENYVKGIPNNSAGPTYGLHNDEGTAYVTENNNVLDIDPGVTYTINCEDYGKKHDLTILNTYATVYKMGVNPPTSTIDVPVVVPDNVWPLAQYNIALKAGVQEAYRSILPASLFPVQDYVFPASCSVEPGTSSIDIRSSGDASNTVWFAPTGTTNFTEGATMTKAAGDATSIAIPSAPGTYKMFVLDSGNNVLGESTSVLRVNGASGTNAAPKSDDFKTNGAIGNQWSIVNQDSANYNITGGGLQISTQAGDLSDGSVKNMFVQEASGDWVAQTKVTLSGPETTTTQAIGLLVYGDSQNYLKLSYERRNATTSSYGFYNTINGTKTTIGKTVDANNQLVHFFRIVKTGTKYSAYYSTDGINYKMIGSTASCIDPSLGLIACNGVGSVAPSINAVFESVSINTLAELNADASLSGIKVDGSALSGFDPAVTNYNVYIPSEVTTVPTVTVTPTDPAATVTIDKAADVPGVTTVTVKNGLNKKVYSISFGATLKYEAENATLSGGAKLNTNHIGYSGAGFVEGYYNSTTALTTFTVNVPSAGNYTLTFRYSDGTTGTASTNTGLYINGTKLKNITCNSTNSWDAWGDEVEIVTLNSGANTIAYKAESSSSRSVNIDYITLDKVTDTAAPSWPQDSVLKPTNLADTGVTLTWPDAQDNIGVTSYKLYKGAALLTTVSGTTHSYDVTGLSPHTDYTFKVEAGDAVNNWSTSGPSVTVTTTGEATPPSDTTKLEAENATLSGAAAVVANHTGFSGTGFVGENVSAGAKTSFSVNVPSAGEYAVTLRYSGANSASKINNLALYVNGSKIKNLSLTPTSSWDTWVDSSAETIALNSGANTIDYNVESASWDCANLDYITITKISDTAAPTWTSGTLSASNIDKTGLTLTWSAAQDNIAVSGYKIYKGADLLTTVAGNVLTYDVTGLSPNTSYTFKIEAGDASGNWSTTGPSTTAKTLEDNTTPVGDVTAPTWTNGTLSVSNIGKTGLTLTWSAAEDNTAVTGYRIYEGTDLLTTVTGNVFTYDVTGLSPNTSYTFKVEAGDASSNWSQTGPSATAKTLEDNTTPVGDVTPPTWDNGSLSAADITKTGVNLTWTAAKDDTAVTGYRIYKGSDLLATVAGDVLSYNVTGLSADTAYVFKVEAGDAKGNWSTNGPSKSVTTLKESSTSSGGSTSTGGTSSTTGNTGSTAGKLEVKDGVITVIQPKTQGNVASIEIPKDTLDQVLKNSSTAKIVVSAANGVNNYVQTLPVSSLQSSDSQKEIAIVTPVGTAVLPVNALSGENITQKTIDISLAASDNSTLSQNMQNQIDGRPVVDVNIMAGGSKLSISNSLTPVKVSIDYKPTASELANTEHIVVWSIENDGSATPVTSGKYDKATGKVTFDANESGKYAVTYVEKAFEDTDKTKWAENPIEVLASKGIIGGTSQTTFSPEKSVTRADYLTLLMKALGLKSNETTAFDDVSSDAYYFNAVATAKTLGITSGTGNNKFNPDDLISRQDMIVLTEKALIVAKEMPQNGSSKDLEGFSDKSSISNYAVGSIANFVNAGLISGSNGNINPNSNATRAEAAVLIYKIYNK